MLLSCWTDDVVPTSSSCSTENSRILAPAFTFNCVLLSLRDASVLPKLFRRKYTKREARNCRGGLRQKEADENRIEALECADEDLVLIADISALLRYSHAAFHLSSATNLYYLLSPWPKFRRIPLTTLLHSRVPYNLFSVVKLYRR